MYKSNLLSIHCVRAMIAVCALLSLFFSAHTAQAQGQPPQTPLSYIENGFTFSLPTGVPFFAKGAGSFPNGNGSVSNNATDSVIAYCPSCGTTGVLTITNNSNATFKLTSFNLGGFQPPNNFTVNVVGYDLNSNVVYQSGAISVTGIYSIRTPTSSTLQGVQLGMTTAVSSITITPSNGGSDCVCLEKFVLETGGNTVVALDGVGATTTVTAPAAANNNNNNNNNNAQTTSISGTLTISAPGRPPVSSTSLSISALDPTLDRKLDGGKLVIDTANYADSKAYKITSNGGIIDIIGHNTQLSGTITDDAGPGGKLYVINSSTGGKLKLDNPNNTFSGGYSIQPGAVLEIADSGALGTGGLDLVGATTLASTLSVSGTTTITQQITVSGDPNFNIAPGTTTIIATGITDGVSAGDVVVNNDGTSNGTLVFSAVNTYTGPTTIEAGTLVLTGVGSIATTSALTNNATLDLSAASAIVNLTGSGGSPKSAFTQSSHGNLIMAGAAAGFQKLVVNGAASVAGTLTLNTTAGAYTAGRYTLLTATDGVSGNFSTLSTNLSNFTALHYVLDYNATNVFLDLFTGLSSKNTLSSLNRSAGLTVSALSQKTTETTNTMNYDCRDFSTKDMCVSFQARYTGFEGMHDGAGVLIAATRFDPHVRAGVFVDQSALKSNKSGVDESNQMPLFGAFVGFTQNTDYTGFQSKVAVSGSTGKLTTTRDTSLAYTEAGSGKSTLASMAAGTQIGWGIGLGVQTTITPYLGLRYSNTQRDPYTETVTAAVTEPVSYARFTQRQLTGTMGLNLAGAMTQTVGYHLGIGGEYDIKTYVKNFAGSSTITGLETFAFNPNPTVNRLRPAMDFGVTYSIDPNQKLVGNIALRGQAYTVEPSITSMAGYQISF